MGLDKFLVGVLVDPIDREGLLYVEADSVLFNPRRNVAYAVNGAIPVLLPDEARPVTPEEAARWASAGVATGGSAA